ncbi:multidrug effflux MFS transporter [Fastidiosibacter lacustris]|uniref:multidrug effflux MFS transporter n=1 Tax=Fastidiosibacter lacustris TaxID=2056695 RepID=UPI000E354F77|nr:multidrug effflux MFS transporter [Fastidiosibacter lacustris]
MSAKNYKWPYQPLTTVFLLAPVVFSFALALDTYMPVIPEMKRILNTSQEMVQLTLSLFFLVTGFGQLILGPLSDQFGRYKILLSSVILFFIGSLLCANSGHIGALIIFRILQGIGACGMSVSAFAIVRDAFSGKQSAMIYSFLNAMISVSPILGPIIGVILTTYFPWHAIFYFLAILGAFTFILVIFFVKESSHPDNRKRFDSSLIGRYLNICKSLTFWAYTFPAIAGISAFFTLFSMTPYIIQTLDEARSQIGVFFGMAGGAFLVGSIISGTIVHKFGVLRTSILGTILILFSGVLLIVIYQINGLSLWGFFGPSMLATFGCALTAGSGASGALEPFGAYPGAASAMLGALQLGGSSIIGSIATLFAINTSYPLACTIIITSVISLVLLIILSWFSSKTH